MAKPKKGAEPDRPQTDADAPKIGRPKIADDAKRSTLVRVLTTEAEYEELKHAAETEAMSVSTWMRTLALNRARRGPKAG